MPLIMGDGPEKVCSLKRVPLLTSMASMWLKVSLGQGWFWEMGLVTLRVKERNGGICIVLVLKLSQQPGVGME